MLQIAINGFGRIGRNTLRNLLVRKPTGIRVVAINDLADPKTLEHLFKYDSVHGVYPGEVTVSDNTLIIDGEAVTVLCESDPSQLPWADLGIDVVIESTGKFTAAQRAHTHLQSGARQVIISAPSADREIPTIVLGVNDTPNDLRAPVLSCASCTTNNVAPLVKVIDDNWGITDGFITTVHSMTGDQNLHDAPHRDLRRARAASASIIPTTTGAAKAITNVFPHLEGRLGGAGIRVPVLNGSLTDFTCNVREVPTEKQINDAFRRAADEELSQVLQYTEDPIVSVDIMNNPYSCVFDASLTSVVGGLVKVVGWYDNEYAYSNRLVDMLTRIAVPNQS